MKIYDNGGKTWDRYTVIIEPFHFGKSCDALCLSENCDTPSGFSQCSDVYEGADLGKEVNLEDLPTNVQNHILLRVSI